MAHFSGSNHWVEFLNLQLPNSFFLCAPLWQAQVHISLFIASLTAPTVTTHTHTTAQGCADTGKHRLTHTHTHTQQRFFFNKWKTSESHVMSSSRHRFAVALVESDGLRGSDAKCNVSLKLSFQRRGALMSPLLPPGMKLFTRLHILTKSINSERPASTITSNFNLICKPCPRFLPNAAKREGGLVCPCELAKRQLQGIPFHTQGAWETLHSVLCQFEALKQTIGGRRHF